MAPDKLFFLLLDSHKHDHNFLLFPVTVPHLMSIFYEEFYLHIDFV